MPPIDFHTHQPVIKLKITKAPGLTIPQPVLIRADHLIR